MANHAQTPVTIADGKAKKNIRHFMPLYVMLLPGVFLVGLLAYYPFSGLYIAFSNYKLGFPIFSSEFAGLKHFRAVLHDVADLGYLLRNTLAMNFGSLILGLTVAVFFAIAINEIKIMKLKKAVQTVSFLPFFLSWAIVYAMLQAFFSAETGVVNTVLKQLGMVERGIAFLSEPNYSWRLVIFTNLWKMLGYNSVIFLSTIDGIDPEMYDVAQIDGANRLQRTWYITLPFLIPTLEVLLILNVGWIMNSNFDQYYLFTNAMNRLRMEVFDMYIYRFGLKQMNYPYATAVGLLKSIAGVSMLVFVNFVSKRLNRSSVA